MRYLIKMHVDYVAINFIHPGPGAEAVKFMEQISDYYRSYSMYDGVKNDMVLEMMLMEDDNANDQ